METNKMTMEVRTGLEIAVIGMAGRFPGAKNIQLFWNSIKSGKELVSFFSTEELKEAGVEPELLNNPNYVKAYGLLDDIEYFDASFFGYTPREAEILDPQMRIFHECVWTALEDAGYEPGDYDGLIGLYAGATLNLDWTARAFISGKSDEIGKYAAGQLIQKDYLTLRISYKLNLMGPSFVLSTACSTSLVAIHVACQSLLNGECDMALAGGVTVLGMRKQGYVYREGMIGSPDGHCRAFDAMAKGFAAGDGAGVVVLKRLEEAITARDHIYSVIKGTAINNDGIRKAGFTASSVEGQAEVIKMALQMAEVQPSSIGYIEAHGTGTELGDPVEIEGLKLAFNTDKKGFCGIGSVKTNIGHIDSAAGVAGFIKTVLALKHRLIPPTLHFKTPNPEIDFINSFFYVSSKLTEWENGEYPLRAGVSSFGIGGTNAHVILEEAPGGTGGLVPMSNVQHQLIILSANTKYALERMKQNLAEYFKINLLNRGNHENPTNRGPTLADAAYTLQVGRKTFAHRWMAVSSTVDETIEALTSPGAGETHRVSPEEEGFEFEKTGPAGDKDSLLQIGRLWLHGHNIDWKGLYSQDHRCRISLPTYPFERQRYWIEGVPPDVDMDMATQKPSLTKKKDVSDWFYVPSWKKTTPLSLLNWEDLIDTKRNWLIFVDDYGIGKKIGKRFRDNHHDVVYVKKGETFSHINDWEYTINHKHPGDYEKLVEDLKRKNKKPGTIVHLWSLSEEGNQPGIDTFYETQNSGFYTLLFLIQALAKYELAISYEEDISQFIQVIVITNGVKTVTGKEKIYPEKSTLLGLCQTIPLEYLNITTRGIDLAVPGTGLLKDTELVDQLTGELLFDTHDSIVAYRGDSRWVNYFEPIRLLHKNGTPVKLKERGVYLITGGLGRDSLIRAKYLAETVKARLILTGRSEFPDRENWNPWLETHPPEDPVSEKIKKLLELEALGAEILVIRADAASETDMKAVMERVDKTFGKLEGVIHAAGITGIEFSVLIPEIGRSDVDLHFKPKVFGLYTLEKVLRGRHLDFCILTSSIASFTSGVGLSAYTAASIFMDTFANKHYKKDSLNWLSLNWQGVSPEETVEAFHLLLNMGSIPQLTVSPTDLTRRIEERTGAKFKHKKIEKKQAISPIKHKRPHLMNDYIAPRNQVEESLVQVWENLFGIESLGIRDDFLELGGDSLKAFTVIAAIQKKMNVNISLGEFLNNTTVQELARYISNHSRKDNFISIEPTEKKEYYALSSAQKRLYIIHQIEENNLSYNISKVWMLEGKLPHQEIEESFEKLIQQHESLRTSFDMLDNEPIQVVHDKVEFEIEYDRSLVNGHFSLVNCQGRDEVPSPIKVEKIIRDFIRPFDLSQAPLLRVGLIKLQHTPMAPGGHPSQEGKEDKHLLMVDMHHIISDGVSLDIMLKDFMLLFSKLELPPLKFQYKDFPGWLNKEQQQKEKKRQEEYWLKKFEKNIPVLHLPMDYDRPAVQGFEGDSITFEIDEKETEHLKKLAADQEATLFMALIAIYNVFLSRLSGQEDIIVGTGTDGRRHAELMQVMGMFVNTLALRNHPARGKTFNTFLKEIKEDTLMTFENQDYPFEELVEKVVPNKNLNQNPLFNTVIVSNNMVVEPDNLHNIESSQLDIKRYPFHRKVSSFDIGLLYAEIGKKLYLEFEYSTKLFKKETMEKFVTYFKEIASTVIENNDINLENITISHQFLRAGTTKPVMELNI